MSKKIILVLILALGLSLLPLAGCSSPAQEEGTEELIPVVVGATPVPHAEILEFVKDKMAAEGFDLQIRQFTDYVQPNLATDSGEIIANFFQHVPYMEHFNEEYGTDLVSIFPVHFEPYGLYKARVESLDELHNGAIIAVPNDPTNEARALQLLEAAGLITLKEGAGLTATKMDIVDNPKNLDIKELEAAQIPLVLPDVDMAVINGNYALQAGLHIGTDAVAVEDKESIGAVTFANPIVVKAGNENDPGVQALVSVLNTSDVRNFINGKYDGGVVPVF